VAASTQVIEDYYFPLFLASHLFQSILFQAKSTQKAKTRILSANLPSQLLMALVGGHLKELILGCIRARFLSRITLLTVLTASPADEKHSRSLWSWNFESGGGIGGRT
jgi:hypothetical protein